MNRERLDQIAENIRLELEKMNVARDQAYHRSRGLTSVCARAIRAVHREEWEQANQLIEEAAEKAGALIEVSTPYPSVYYAGYTQDALKELAEAHLTRALVRNSTLPGPEDLGVEGNTWLNGLAEATTELRRRILDIVRHGHSVEAERLLGVMDDVYTVLVSFDFTDAVSGGLRRRTDTVRAVLERTRGDVTTSLRQAELEQALEALEERLGRRSTPS